ncbi:hypothetical protein LUZ62_071081 [Rhynchospora pubera]|uniref:Neprosin PEP catalytic domain-containing protein n=1 Tax=Rhynchospora pubera TaxID=906938 RepID=A0AAV8D2L3_9POAL|nr:hypothetical protein LUZ62_071081 [Rhynchospora pubera]
MSQSSAYIAAISNWDGLEYVAAGVHTTKDGTEGCYNDYCPGFVIANGSNLLPGQALAPLSNYGGEMRYITIRIKKDEKTGDWSLYREDEGGTIGGMTLLGWWPQSLFKSLSDRANVIQWTGEVNYQYNETGPSMGSGHFSDEHEGKAAGFFDVCGFDSSGLKYIYAYRPIPLVDKSYCYDISPWYDPDFNYPAVITHHFFYGGPSGCSR